MWLSSRSLLEKSSESKCSILRRMVSSNFTNCRGSHILSLIFRTGSAASKISVTMQSIALAFLQSKAFQSMLSWQTADMMICTQGCYQGTRSGKLPRNLQTYVLCNEILSLLFITILVLCSNIPLRSISGSKRISTLPVAVNLLVHVKPCMKDLPNVLVLTPLVADLIVNNLQNNLLRCSVELLITLKSLPAMIRYTSDINRETIAWKWIICI